jgi:hypothetical protein
VQRLESDDVTGAPDQGALPVGGKSPWRILTLHQPWASAVITGTPAAGHKDVENRGWPTEWRHRVFIHAGRTLDIPAARLTPQLKQALRASHLSWEDCEVPDWAWPEGTLDEPLRLPFGQILGYVRYTACTMRWNPSRWAERGCYHHWMKDPVPLDSPIPAAGRLNLWTPGGKDVANAGLRDKLDAIP